MKVDKQFNKQFDIMVHDGDHPECWHRDNLSIIGQKLIEYRAHSKVHFPWISRLHKVLEWYGKYQPYDCDYVELTDTELQTCVTTRKISKVSVSGASISAFYEDYVNQRLANIQLYNVSTAKDALEVELSTLKFPHILWRKNLSGWERDLDEFKAVQPHEEKYFLSGFYYSSEREPHVTVELSNQLTKLAYERLTPRGWKMINAFDTTAAFTYDSATQNDGLHIIGPPAKQTIVRFLHHLCGDFASSQT